MLSLAYRALVKKVPFVIVIMLFIVHKNSCLNVQNVVQLYDTPTFHHIPLLIYQILQSSLSNQLSKYPPVMLSNFTNLKHFFTFH